jgi:hypothetical protein
VLVFARALAGGGTIESSGSDAEPIEGSTNIGGGGGGGGGTIFVRADDGAAFAGAVLARGGRGADLVERATNRGPGAGGGGGRIRA